MNDRTAEPRIPTHRCKDCGALWIKWPPDPGQLGPLRDGGWSLFSKACGECCDNAPMRDQIEELGSYVTYLLHEVALNNTTVDDDMVRRAVRAYRAGWSLPRAKGELLR